MKSITFCCDDELYEWLQEQCEINNEKMSSMIRILLDRMMFARKIKNDLGRK